MLPILIGVRAVQMATIFDELIIRPIISLINKFVKTKHDWLYMMNKIMWVSVWIFSFNRQTDIYLRFAWSGSYAYLLFLPMFALYRSVFDHPTFFFQLNLFSIRCSHPTMIIEQSAKEKSQWQQTAIEEWKERSRKKQIDDESILHTIKIMCTIEKW